MGKYVEYTVFCYNFAVSHDFLACVDEFSSNALFPRGRYVRLCVLYTLRTRAVDWKKTKGNRSFIPSAPHIRNPFSTCSVPKRHPQSRRRMIGGGGCSKSKVWIHFNCEHIVEGHALDRLPCMNVILVLRS